MTPLFLCGESLYLTYRYPLNLYHRLSSAGLRRATGVLRCDALGALANGATNLLLRAWNCHNESSMGITDEGD